MYLDLFEKLEIPYGAISEYNSFQACSWKFIDYNKKIKSIPNKLCIHIPLVLEAHELEFYAFRLLNSLKPGDGYSYTCLCRDLEYGLFVRKGHNGIYPT
jgi:hypothetical protein